jgi:hypothetical protein
MTDTLTPGSEWLLPVTHEKPGVNAQFFLTQSGYHVLFDQPEISTLIPASRLADLEAEVARWQQLYEDARHDLTKAEMEVERLREALAGWMLKNSYATGHGDTFDDLLSELDWQHAKRTNP